MSEFSYSDHPHRRWNPLQKKWMLCSPHRAKRPWMGAQETTSEERPYDPKNYLLPGATRTSGDVNPDYKSTFPFVNDFSALLPDTPEGHVGSVADDDLFVAESVRGECRVICFHPRHDLTIAEMNNGEIRAIVDTWADQYKTLGEKDYINYVQIFENKGAAMGCSNPHPHGQIWSGSFIPEEPSRSFQSQKEYFEKHGRLLLEDYAIKEEQKDERIIFKNDSFRALVPFWAVWPFEVMIIPRPGVHVTNLLDLSDKQRDDLAACMRVVCCKYDNMFKCSFPYSMGIHQAPTDGKAHPYQQMYLVYYPPLLRSATVKKFMVGFEMLGEAQRDITAEQAAARLRALPETHYRPRLTDEEYREKYLVPAGKA
eukprot:comp18318_c0_seq1/m.19386 comp18318_c0_seq1/g.19386  ORF comp18318_c0_seq1/g.19386 comp18318_c0_seq1/m.19386 type:complete len:369 (-) comp18318_c0_seq1:20-1126(-)